MKKAVILVLSGGVVSGCAALAPQTPLSAGAPTEQIAQIDTAAQPETLQTVIRPVPAVARTVEEFDTTTQHERAAAAQVGVAAGTPAESRLGLTVASLGSPTEPGFWLKTPLVSAPAKGRAVYPGTGKSVAVDLIPIDGPKTAGSRMSLAAMRVIEAPLTGLPEVEVYRSGT